MKGIVRKPYERSEGKFVCKWHLYKRIRILEIASICFEVGLETFSSLFN